MLELRGAVGGVQEGLNGRLFLGSQDGFDLGHFTGGDPFPPDFLERWRATLTRRGKALSQRGIPYVFFLVPDAPSVYPEDLPPHLQANFRSPGALFIEAMGDIPGVTFVYPLNAMRQARGGLEIYKKKDSHWTTYGSYIAYREFMRHVQPLVPCRVVPARDVRFSLRRSYGDLGSLTEPEQAEEIPSPVIAGPEVAIVASYEGVGRQTGTETCAGGDLPPCRALFFRDSYMTDLAPYLARSFSNFLTLGTTTRVMLDAVDHWHANLVVSQVAERKLFYNESDHQLEGFDTIFGASFRGLAASRLLKALLMLRQDPAAAAALVVDDADALSEDPVHAFSLALIAEAAGDLPAASRFAARAAAKDPPLPAALALSARIALASGRLPEAVSLSGQAAAAAPENGYFQEFHVYCLVQAQDAPAAADAAEAALQHVTDSPNLWYWASVCHEASGHADLAAARIKEALRLTPADAAYQAHLEKLSVH